MSQSTFPFSLDAEPDAEERDDQRNKKAIVVAGAVVAALVIGAAGYLLLGGSGDEADSAYVPVVHHPAVVTGSAATPKKAVKKLPAAYDAQLGRDPFKALYVLPVAETGAAGSTTDSTVPAAVGTSADGTTTGSAGTGTTSTGTGAAPVAPAASSYVLKLTGIGTTEQQLTTWQVAGVSKTVLPGQRFGNSGELVVLAFNKNAQGIADRAVLQVGDDSPVQVAVGQALNVL
jgi:hypothetical protein